MLLVIKAARLALCLLGCTFLVLFVILDVKHEVIRICVSMCLIWVVHFLWGKDLQWPTLVRLSRTVSFVTATLIYGLFNAGYLLQFVWVTCVLLLFILPTQGPHAWDNKATQRAGDRTCGIFISYSRSDQEKVKPVVDALSDRGYCVFWDISVFSGQFWDLFINRWISQAQLVVVFWSRRSVHSQWVHSEARHGYNRKCLHCVLLDDIEFADVPVPFDGVNCLRLSELGVEGVADKIGDYIKTLAPKPHGVDMLTTGS
jgi:hypothetical protein